MAILRLDTGCNAYIPHIHIGREAENDVSQIDFVVQSWIDTYGDGGVSLAVQRYGDKEAYIVPLAIVDGVATWTISDTDTAKEGRGSVQLTYVVGEKVKKSQIYKIVVDSSLVGSDAVPDPYDNWLAILTEMTAQTGANADSARVSAQEAAKSEANAKASETNAKASETNAKASEEASAQSATSASASAVNASADAQRAETAEANAEESAANAKADADSAKADADRAEQAAATATAKAQEATQDAQTANTASQTATAKASEASASASTASTAATTATTKAQAASESATTAQTAQTSAQTAQGLAESARDNAITAKTDAESARDEAQDIVDGITGKVEQIDSNTERIESLEDDRYKPYAVDTASGAVASFSDGADNLPMKSVKVDIEPLQDLHGYDAPWPAGGGKNLINIPDGTQTVNGVTSTAKDGIVTLSGTATARAVIILLRNISIPAGTYRLNGAQQTMPVSMYMNFSPGNASGISETNGISDPEFTLTEPTSGDQLAYLRLDIASGINTNGMVFKPMIRKSTESATFATYSNICPITGWIGATVTRTGKNIINPSELVYSTVGYNVWYGTQLPPDTDFVFSTDSIIKGLYVAYSDDDEMPSISGAGWTNITYRYDTTSLGFNSGSHKWYRLMTYEKNGVIRDRLYQLELGTTATAYEPYQGETYDITFPSEAGTVYGGSLDVTNGVLTVDRARVNLGQLNWTRTQGTSAVVFTTAGFTGKKTGVTNVKADSLATTNITAWTTDKPDCSICGSASSTTVAVRYDACSTKEQLRSALDGKYAVYELATPQTYQLTPTEVKTLLGSNNFWADTGDTSVEYRADTKLYINKKIAEAISALS